MTTAQENKKTGKSTKDETQLLIDQQSCCGGTCGSKQSTKKDEESCDGNCGCCSSVPEVELNPEQIAQINTILGNIDDEELADGEYDLTPEQLKKLQEIFG